jgi:hypothetical protein
MISPVEVAPASSPSQTKFIRLGEGVRKQVVFCMLDSDGKPQHLRQEIENPPAGAADFSPESAAVGANVTVHLRSRPGGDASLYGNLTLDIPGAILDQDEHRGFVEFTIATNNFRPGVYAAEVQRHAAATLTDRWPVMILIEPSAMQMLSGRGPLTIPEVRLALMDVESGDNGAPFSNLLDDVEFRDLDIVFAMKRVIDMWNETPPHVDRYTPRSFPYRYWWLEGTCGILLTTGAHRYRRNQLTYNAGGVAINDQNKSDEYQRAGEELMAKFKQWMMQEKYRINIERTWAVGL